VGDGTMTVVGDNELEGQIAEWRAYMDRRRELRHPDAEELEDHLRSRITELTEAGLRADEAFLIAVKRMGSLDELSREFAREHSERLWKQLVLPGEPDAPTSARSRRELPVMVLCAVLAALAIKAPACFGRDMSEDDIGFYARNISLFALPALAAYFAWQRRVGPRVIGVLASLFVLGALAANVYPLAEDSQVMALTAIHLPLALWLVVGVAYAGGDWRSDRRRMDFIRFTGEWLIYLALIGLGGGVLMVFTMGTFEAIGLDAGEFIGLWLLPCGAMGAVIVSAWLVEAKQFAATLLAFLVAVVWTNNGIDVERDALILFDLLLVIVLGLLLYAISARDLTARAGLFDRLQFALIASALIIDVMVLVAVTGRITEWGFTPNKTAALGENIILLANLTWSAWLFLGFVRGRTPFARLDRWQTRYVIVYAVWAWTVVLAFPPLFGFA
jgi:hypothetical protein